MKGLDLIRMQLQGSCDQVAGLARESEDVWTQRSFPNASLPGFVLWHCTRIVDWGVHSVVRNVPEVGAAVQWRERIRFDLGHGAGLTREQADEAARTVGAEDVAAYAGALRESITAWLDSIAEADLDGPVDVRRAGARNPLYATDAAWEEVKQLEGIPAWQLLARPCIAHIRVHLGEAQTLGAAARGTAIRES